MEIPTWQSHGTRRRLRLAAVLAAWGFTAASLIVAAPQSAWAASAASADWVTGGTPPTHTLTAAALVAPSGAVAWGWNRQGQLGIGSMQEAAPLPVAVSGLSEVTAVAGGGNDSLALLLGGSVMAWGENEAGQLGNGTTTNSDLPVAVSGLNEVTAIASGGSDNLSLLENGAVMAWGWNALGQLGDGTNTGPEICGRAHACSKTPVQVSGLSEVVAIAAGGAHNLALLRNGTVTAWGFNDDGQLGDGTSTGPDVCGSETRGGKLYQWYCSKTPVQVSGLSEVAAIAAGGEHSLALLKNGTVMAWGANQYGQLGDGSDTGPEACEVEIPLETQPCSRTPVAVPGLSEVAAIAAGERFSLALLKNGTVMAWGGNVRGQLGDGVNTGTRSKTNTGLETCEDEEGGSELGYCNRTPVAVTGLSGATAIAAGDRFGLALLKDGTVTAWGENGGGQLGDGSSYFQTYVPSAVSGLGGVTAISAGAYQSLAIGALVPIAQTVTEVEPGYGPAAGGTTAIITGTDFNGVTGVTFGPTNATSFKIESETEITAVSPPGVGAADVRVVSAGGTSPATAKRFRYYPTITEMEPDSGPAAGDTPVTITGTNFNEVVAVRFGSTKATNFQVVSEDEIEADSPPGKGTVYVTVETGGGTSPPSQFTYIPFTEKLELENWMLSGALKSKKLGPAIKLPEGSSFSANGEINPETDLGSIAGDLLVPLFDAPMKLSGRVPVSFGVTLTQAGPAEGAIYKSYTIPGDETLSIPVKLDMSITSLSFPATCTTSVPISLNLVDNLTLKQLHAKRWRFEGTASLPSFDCEGEWPSGFALRSLPSGSPITYSITVRTPRTSAHQ